MNHPIGIWLALVLVVAACGSDRAESEANTTVSTTDVRTSIPTATPTAATPTASTSSASPTGPEESWESYEWEMFHHAYESVGYSCDEPPAKGCDGDSDMSVTQVWVGFDDVQREIDFVDFFLTLQPGADSTDPTMDALGDADNPEFEDSGHGVRIVQLERPPLGSPAIEGGMAWLELTVSSVSAGQFAVRGPRVQGHPGRYFAPTSIDPVTIEPDAASTHLIEKLVLESSTADMMRWIIVLKHPGTYLSYVGYAGFGTGTHNWLWMQIRRG